MDVDTLLTRQMELHTSVRQPPKSPEALGQLTDIMRNYRRYFETLRRLADQFAVEPETIFQSLMYISIGGSVNIDRQHGDGSVPMHQAKVLARANAIELAPVLRKEIPTSELMVYVGLSKDLRSTIRVKVEDGNDLNTAEKSVVEAVEYLNYIERCAERDPEKMYAIYMAEDPATLAQLVGEASFSGTFSGTFRDTVSDGLHLPSLGEDGNEIREPTPLPSPLSNFLTELKKQCDLLENISSPTGTASQRMKTSTVLLDWVIGLPVEYFAANAEAIVAVLTSPLGSLVTERRSALFRLGCELTTVLLQRLSEEPEFLKEIERDDGSACNSTFGKALTLWTTSLTRGIFKTIAAISISSDKALRAIVIQSHGHIAVVKALLQALAGGSQTELRRKCLGYLALCVAAAHHRSDAKARSLVPLLAPIVANYVMIGDSPSRKMARALSSVLRLVTDKPGALAIPDERTEALIQQERLVVEPAVRDGPQELEALLFDADNFASSIRSTFSGGSQRGRTSTGTARLGSAGLLPQPVSLLDEARCVPPGDALQEQRWAVGHAFSPGAEPRAKELRPLRSAVLRDQVEGPASHTKRQSKAGTPARSISKDGGRTGVRHSIEQKERPLGTDAFGGPSANPTPLHAGGSPPLVRAGHRSSNKLSIQGDAAGFGDAKHAVPRSQKDENYLPLIPSRMGGPTTDGNIPQRVSSRSPPTRGASQTRGDRLIPLSLREKGANEPFASGAVTPSCVSPTNSGAGAADTAPRISLSLRRKIEEQKAAKGPLEL